MRKCVLSTTCCSGLLACWPNRQMHLSIIYLEHSIGGGRKRHTSLLLHISVIGSYGYALKAKGCTLSYFSCRLASMLVVPLFTFPVTRVCCFRERHCVVTMWYSMVRLERCLGVSCVLCVVDFLLTFWMWLWVPCLCKCELHFKVAALVVGFSCSAVVCVFYGQRVCEIPAKFLAPSICFIGEVNFI
jgi:hypothetical protein